ncbi:hypothetical protein BJ878DRAFT_525855 [Calycina marina]|uniref:Uncharacterized protein n=1 Tax=Calycina marina TaxID=1763456 RepID=A0A9P7YVK2_9HELO|nr:hypothetical protein BJ878DRAFT_525855 [Calycina marina]
MAWRIRYISNDPLTLRIQEHLFYKMDSDKVSQIHESVVDDWLHRLGMYNTQGIEKPASSTGMAINVSV